MKKLLVTFCFVLITGCTAPVKSCDMSKFTPSEVDSIKNETVFVGMSVGALKCAMGNADYRTTVHATSNGVMTVYIYTAGLHKRFYFYTMNGVIVRFSL